MHVIPLQGLPYTWKPHNTEPVYVCMSIRLFVSRSFDSDFTLNGGVSLPMAFLFQPSDMFLSFTLTIMDDDILETDEMFSLTLFKNTSVINVDIAPRRTTITIIDDEGEIQVVTVNFKSMSVLLFHAEITFGFSNTSISVMENDGSAVVGFEVFEPVDPNLISDTFRGFFFVNVIAVNGTATSTSVVCGIVYLKDTTLF